MSVATSVRDAIAPAVEAIGDKCLEYVSIRKIDYFKILQFSQKGHTKNVKYSEVSRLISTSHSNNQKSPDLATSTTLVLFTATLPGPVNLGLHALVDHHFSR